jgi:hypothetical protein
MIGMAHKMADFSARATYSSNFNSYLYYSANGCLWYNSTSKNYAESFTENILLTILLDMHKGEIRFAING